VADRSRLLHNRDVILAIGQIVVHREATAGFELDRRIRMRPPSFFEEEPRELEVFDFARCT
jgi:hypothetical protein